MVLLRAARLRAPTRSRLQWPRHDALLPAPADARHWHSTLPLPPWPDKCVACSFRWLPTGAL